MLKLSVDDYWFYKRLQTMVCRQMTKNEALFVFLGHVLFQLEMFLKGGLLCCLDFVAEFIEGFEITFFSSEH